MTVAFIPRRACQIMPWLLVIYAGASLLHFTHNAEYLTQYPNLPTSWARADIYFAWCCITAIGLCGYVLYSNGFVRAGLTVLAVYGVLGLDGLLHYTRASVAQHSAAMNFTIWAEVAAAALFLVNLAGIAAAHIGLSAGRSHR